MKITETEDAAQAPAQADPFGLAMYEGIVTSAMDAIISIDDKQRILFFNPAAERMFGRAAETMMGKSLRLLLPVGIQKVHHQHVDDLNRTGVSTRMIGHLGELSGRRADGTEFAIEASISQMHVGNRRIFTTIVRDVSERQQNIETLEKRAHYLSLLNELHQSILAAPSSGAIGQIVLDRVSELVGYPRSAILLATGRKPTRTLFAAYPKMDPTTHARAEALLMEFQDTRGMPTTNSTGSIGIIADIRSAGLPRRLAQALVREKIIAVLEVPLNVGDAKIGALQLYAPEPRVPTTTEMEMARHVVYILAVALQQARLHEVISTTRERLHALARRQLEQEEMQRRQLSRELHDMIGQNLTALNLNLYNLAKKLPPDTPEAVHTRLADSEHLVAEIVERIRGLMAEMRPSILDDLGLTSALRWYGGEFSKRTELPVRITVQELEPRLPQAAETALFRIAQEALTNTAKHSHAQGVWLDLQLQDKCVRLTVRDDGDGFDFVAMRQDPSKQGVGIVDMRERAESIGGRMWVECTPGVGTQVIAQVPFSTHD